MVHYYRNSANAALPVRRGYRMDEMYNNENNSSFENQDGAYGGQYQQPSVQDQLQYQY